LSLLRPFILVFFGHFTLSAQVTIWMEDFTGYPNATLDAPGKWTSEGTDCDDPGLNIGNQFGVFNGQFVVNEVEGAPCCAIGGGNDNHFETVGIDISDYCDVEVSLVTAGSGGLDCLNAGGPLFVCLGNNAIDDFHDQMLIEIQVDGVVVQTKYICGTSGLGADNFTGITGNTLVIRIFAATKFGAETYTFDNIIVSGNEPTPTILNLANTTFCPTAAAVSLNTNQGGITGAWSGPGVSNNSFNPVAAGPGIHTLTFTPNAGQCRLPNTIDVTVYPFPPAFPTGIDDCASPLSGQAVFNLITLNDDVNGGAGNAVSWYTNAAGTIPIANPANFTTTFSVTVYARVTDNNGCISNPVPITVTVNTCNIALPNLSCSPFGDVNSCNVCEDAIPGVNVTLYVNIAGIPPGGYDITVTYTGPSGSQSEVFTGYIGGPLNFNIEENTTFSLSEVVCPNGCIDQFGLGDQVNFQLIQTPQINNPGPQAACNAYTLPPITGQNLPPGVAYFTQPNGGGTKLLPGNVITDSTLLYIYANNSSCTDQESFPVYITPVSDTTLLQKTTCDTAQAGITVQTLQNASGCDSVVITTTTLVGSDTTLIALNSCNPQDTGIVVAVLQGLVCDSIVITATSLLPSNATIENLITCNQANAGSDTLFLSNVFGCDSLVISNTVYVAADTNLIVQYSCSPQDTGVVSNFITAAPCGLWNITTTLLAPTNVVLLNDGTCNQALVGIDTVALVNQFGCDSLIITNTIFTAADTTIIQLGSCNPQDTGVVVQLLQGTLCDSFVITQTTLLPADTVQILRASCNPAQVGVVDSAFVNAFGCNSLAVITTTQLSGDTVQIQRTSCNPVQVGVVDSAFVNAFGCNSLAVITTTQLSGDTVQIQRTSCNPAQVGVVDSLFVNAFGCNSLAVITTTQLAVDTIQIQRASCNPAQVGVVDSVFANAFGCNSLAVITTTQLPSDTLEFLRTSCDSAQVGVVDSFYFNSFGCLSMAIITTTLLPSNTLQIQRTTCNPALAGVVDSVYVNTFGCSSVAVITTTLLPSDTVQTQRSSCDPSTVGVTDSMYINAFGCSSLAVITTSLLPSDTVQIQRSSCKQAQAGVVDSVYVNASGCSSLAIITTTLLLADTLYMQSITCDPILAGTFDSLVVDPAGCKTLYITNITYTAPVVGSIIDTLCTGDSLWINGVAYFAGNPNGTEVLISEVSGCDSAIVSIDLFFADIDAFLSLVNPDCNQDEGIVVIETINGLQPPYLYRVDNDPIISFDTLPYAFNLPVGTYDIHVLGAGACAWTQPVTIPPAPVLFVNLGLDEQINLGEAVFLSPATNFGAASFAWQATDSLPCYTCPELLFQPTQTMLVSLLATDSAGCTAGDSVLITVSVNRLVFLPNVFNPERTDGLNDVFFVSAAEGQVSRIIDFQIYDRWGGQVFGRKNILPNDRSQGWDGTYLGDEMLPGVYVYYVELEYADGETEVLEGDLTLLR